MILKRFQGTDLNIKWSGKCRIEKSTIERYFAATRRSFIQELEFIVLKHFLYVPFNEMKSILFEKLTRFKTIIGEKPFYSVVDCGAFGSELWLLQLFFNDLFFTGMNYKGNFDNGGDVGSNLELDKEGVLHLLFLDDCIYTEEKIVQIVSALGINTLMADYITLHCVATYFNVRSRHALETGLTSTDKYRPHCEVQVYANPFPMDMETEIFKVLKKWGGTRSSDYETMVSVFKNLGYRYGIPIYFDHKIFTFKKLLCNRKFGALMAHVPNDNMERLLERLHVKLKKQENQMLFPPKSACRHALYEDKIRDCPDIYKSSCGAQMYGLKNKDVESNGYW